MWSLRCNTIFCFINFSVSWKVFIFSSRSCRFSLQIHSFTIFTTDRSLAVWNTEMFVSDYLERWWNMIIQLGGCKVGTIWVILSSKMFRILKVMSPNEKILPVSKFYWYLDIWILGINGNKKKTRASRTTGAKGSNFFAINNRLQITDDHMERIRLQVSADNKEHIASNR